jgi:hypothetical protein
MHYSVNIDVVICKNFLAKKWHGTQNLSPGQKEKTLAPVYFTLDFP